MASQKVVIYCVIVLFGRLKYYMYAFAPVKERRLVYDDCSDTIRLFFLRAHHKSVTSAGFTGFFRPARYAGIRRWIRFVFGVDLGEDAGGPAVRTFPAQTSKRNTCALNDFRVHT
jgi:hypothetical protein